MMTEEEATVQEQGGVSSTDAAANAAYEQTKRMLTLRQMQGVLDDLNAGVLNEKDPRVQMGFVAGAEILSGLPDGTLFDADGIRAATGGACSTPSELSQSVLKILKDAQENDFFYNSRIAAAEKDEDWAEVSRLCNEASFGDDKTRYLQQWTPEQVAHLKTRNRNVERSLGFMSYAMGKGMDDPGVLTGFKTAIVMSRGGDLDAMVEQGVFDNLTPEQMADALYVADAMRAGSEMGVLDVLGQIPKGFADELGNVVRGAAWKLTPDDEAKAMRLADLSRKHGGDLDKLYADAKDYEATISELVPMSDIGRYWNNKARWTSDMERWVKAGDLARKRIEAKSILSQLDDAKFLGRGAAGEYLYEAMYMLGSGAAQLAETVVAASAGAMVGGPLGGLAATAAVFGASEVGRSRDEFIAAGMSAKDADELATAIGAATGVIEVTGDFFQFGRLFRRLGVNLAAGGTPAQRAVREAAKRAAQKKPGLVGKARIEEEVAQLAGAKAGVMRRIGRVAKDAAKVTATEFVEEGVSQAAASAMKLSGDWWSVEGERMFTARGELESFIEAMEQTAKYGFWQILPGFAANRALRGGGDAPAALRAEGISQARDGTARLRMRGVTLHDATAAEIAAQAARETRSAARMSGVPLKVIKDWKEGMTQEERERVIGEQKLTEEQVATLDAMAHARALAEAAGDQTLTLEEEVVEINRQIEKLGEADEAEAVQMLDAELLAEEEAARAEEEARSESPKAEEETRNEGEGAPRAEVPAEAKPDAGGGEAVAGRELDALRVRAAELDDRLRAKGLRKAERAKISEELSGVRARMDELSGGNLVLFSRGDGAQGRPALSPTKAALRDRLLLKIAQTAGIRIVRERSAQILGSARNAEVRRRLGGYMGKAWSARANDALERGLRPAPMIADELGVSAEAVEAYMRSPEWHHVGEDFEEVRFFDPDEAPLTDAKEVRDAETARSFLRYVEMLNYDTRKFTVKPRVAGRFESEASDEAYALFTSRGTAVAKEAFEAEDEFRALVEKETASAEELRAAAKATLAAAKSGRKKMEAAAKAFLAKHKDWARERPRRARRGTNGLRYSLEEAFPATAEEREGIEREAKAKGAWLKAPNGEPTNLTPEQWVTVRTAAFKKWFGDWEKSATLAKSFREEDSNANIIRVERDGYTDEFRRIQAESNRLSQEDVAQFHRSSKQLTEDERLALGRVYERLLAGSGNARNDVWTDLTGKGNTFRIARVNGELFHDIFEVNRKYLPNGELVDLHEDYSNAKCFLTDDGMCGFAVEEGGNLVSVFSLNPNKIPERTGFLYAIRDFAREQGATHLDAYASNKQNLEAIYAKTLGFHVAAEMDYAMEYDHDDIAANHGKPKVVFMVDSEVVERRKFDDYDAAVAYQRGATSAASASKVVDGNGEPLVVWHGTREHFYEFEHGRAFGSGDIYGYLGYAFYATNDYETAESYADGGYKRTLGLFLNIRNPYETKNPDHTSPAHGGSFAKHLGVSPREVSPTLRQMGHDGVIATDEEAGYIEYAFYHSTQAKSATENVGTFDAGNPDIRYSLGGGASTIRAWHGSPHEFDAEEGAPFGRFGLSFVGTGEGAQAFGYGIYLTSEEDIARHNYAQRLGDDDVAAAQRALGRFGLAWATFRADELAACVSFSDFKRELRAAAWSLEDLVEEGEMTAEELASDKASIREATKTREAFDALLSAMLATQDYFYESRREDIERALEEAGDGRKAKALREELERFDELKREADANERPRHHLYEARIRVADDASNLLDWVARPSEEQLERIRAGLRERGVSEEAAVRLTAAGSFGEIYRGISEELGGAAKASETLKAAGFAGHKYPADSAGTGAADYSRGTNYVIYDTGATEITDAVRWLRNDSGVVYGYWDEGSGELHLNEDFADFDTPLHEWAHVWLSWVRKADARLAERALAATKETRFYKRLRKDKGSAYAGLSDDALAEEAFAMLCGKDGGEIMAEEGVSTWTKLRRAVLNVFKAALRTLGVSESVLSRLTFRDMQALCLRDLLDDETLSLKALRASVSAKRALEDAASEAIIDNGIKDAARNRAIRSASIAAAGKLLMKKDRMTREQAESAETLSALEESVGRMLPTEPYDVVKSAAKAAQLAAKVVYSSRAKGDAATVDATDAVREANRATRILRAQRVLKAANRAGQIDADMYADAREYAENYTKMTAAGRRSHARGINPTLLKHLYGAEGDREAFSRDFLERGENAKDMTGAIAEIVRGRLPMDAAPYDVLNATRETLRNAYAHQARTWVPSASRERALRLAEAIDVEDTLAGVMKAARTAEAFLREHGVRQAAEATMKNMTRFLRGVVSDASDAAKPTDKRRYSAEFHVFADALLRHLKVYDKARRAIEKARKAKTGKDKAEEAAAAALDAAAAGAEAEVRKVIVELDALENSGDAHGAAAFDAMNAKLSALQLLTNFDPTDAEGVAEIYAEVQEAAHEDAANKKNERERFADRVERDAQALTAALNAREGVEQYDQQFEGKRYVSWLFKYAYGLKQRTESLIRFATGATRRNAERVSNTNHLREVRANTEKEKNKLRRVRAFRAMLSETMGLETDAQVREFSRKMAKKRDELAKFSRSGKVAMSYDQALNLYLGLRQEHVSGRMLGMDAGVRAKLLERNREARILWEQIQKTDELRDALERAGVLRYGDGLVRLLEAERARLDDAATAYFGTALRVYPGTKLYFPIVRMRREATPLTPNATGQANVVPSSALPRVANYRPLDDAQTATGAFFGQIEETEHFAAYGGLSRYYTLLFLNKEFSRVLWDKAGSRVFQQFRKSAADTVNGQFYSADDIGASALMNAAVNITSVLALGFNVGTAIKQMGSFLAFANEIGWTRTFKALLFSDSAEGRLERIEEMTSHPLWAARFQGAGSFHDAKNLATYGSTTLVGGWWKRYAEVSMTTVRLGDALAVLTVGQGLYGATKAKLMRSINVRTGALYTEAEARDEAMGFVMDLADRTQQAGRTANFSAYQRGAKATYRIIGQFMSSTSQMWAMEARALEDIAARGITDKAARDRLLTVMMNNHFVNPVVVWGATLLVQLLFKGELPDEDNATDLIWAMLLGPLGGIFLVGGAITGMFEDTGYADTAFPSLSMMARTGKNAVGFAKSLADEEEGATKKAAYRFLRDASAPTRQAAQLIDAWVKDLDGRESGNEAFN